MDRILAALLFLLLLAVTIITYPEAASAVITLALTSVGVIVFIHFFTDEAAYLQRVFVVGLLLRVVLGLFVHIFELRAFFGGDSITYHEMGTRLYEIWFDGIFSNDGFSQTALSLSNPSWGMHRLVGFIYAVTGPNILAAQFFCAVIGAATAPAVYLCAKKIFDNRSVAKLSALSVAVFPAFVIWSSQLLKDGLIIFLLVVIMTMVLKLQERFDYLSLFILIGSLFAITSLRFYLFYVLAIAIVGSFVIGSSKNEQSIIKRIVLCVFIGGTIAFLAGENLTQKFDAYVDLDRIQKGREWTAKVSESGYGEDLDVSSTGGALAAVPIGFSYVMFAPFPWQATNLRQAIALPETLLWWACMPLLIAGFLYTIKHKLRNAIAVILFTVLLIIAYSITQGNVGTAYRQRTQIQVFLFMFVAVGWQLRKEKKEIENIEAGKRRKRLEEDIRRRRDEDDGPVSSRTA